MRPVARHTSSVALRAKAHPPLRFRAGAHDCGVQVNCKRLQGIGGQVRLGGAGGGGPE